LVGNFGEDGFLFSKLLLFDKLLVCKLNYLLFCDLLDFIDLFFDLNNLLMSLEGNPLVLNDVRDSSLDNLLLLLFLDYLLGILEFFLLYSDGLLELPLFLTVELSQLTEGCRLSGSLDVFLSGSLNKDLILSDLALDGLNFLDSSGGGGVLLKVLLFSLE
jgi:hypothetical protein